ncbi:hypothetical protein V6N13_099811 [Hibiscus sabdariffa]
MCHKVEKVFNLVTFLLLLPNVTSPCVRQAPKESEKKNKAETSRSHADQVLHDVYGVASYLDEATSTLDSGDAGHNESAKELMQSFCICELNISSSPIIPELEISSQEYSQKLMDLTKQYQTIPWQSLASLRWMDSYTCTRSKPA